jgi:hypothetical protein
MPYMQQLIEGYRRFRDKGWASTCRSRIVRLFPARAHDVEWGARSAEECSRPGWLLMRRGNRTALRPVLPAQRGHDREGEQVGGRPEGDAHLLMLAATVVEAITARIARGDDATAAVADVLETAFGLGSDEHDRLVADRAAVERIVVAVLDVLGRPGG